jgi:hypothetical protein
MERKIVFRFYNLFFNLNTVKQPISKKRNKFDKSLYFLLSLSQSFSNFLFVLLSTEHFIYYFHIFLLHCFNNNNNKTAQELHPQHTYPEIIQFIKLKFIICLFIFCFYFFMLKSKQSDK